MREESSRSAWTKKQKQSHKQGAETSVSDTVAETGTWETNHHAWRVGELRFIMLAGPEELTLQVASPEQRGYRVFIHQQAWLHGFSGLQGLGNCKEQDKGEWDKLQSLVLWVPTFWDLPDPDSARSKLSYRGRRSRRLRKILTDPLQYQKLWLSYVWRCFS